MGGDHGDTGRQGTGTQCWQRPLGRDSNINREKGKGGGKAAALAASVREISLLEATGTQPGLGRLRA